MNRIFAFGDIHGHLKPLQALLKMIDFDQHDTLVFLGDYIDRGAESAGVIDQLIQLKNQCNTRFIKGNHEEYMIGSKYDEDVFRTWLRFGGDSTLDSYHLHHLFSSMERIPAAIWDFLNSCEDYVELESHIFCHAPIHPDKPVGEQNEDELRWKKCMPDKPHISSKTIIHGHCPQDNVLFENNYMCIDTHCYGGGWLTAVEITDEANYLLMQANAFGETQSTKLSKVSLYL